MGGKATERDVEKYAGRGISSRHAQKDFGKGSADKTFKKYRKVKKVQEEKKVWKCGARYN